MCRDEVLLQLMLFGEESRDVILIIFSWVLIKEERQVHYFMNSRSFRSLCMVQEQDLV